MAANFRNLFGIRARLVMLALLVISPLVADRIRLVEAERQARIEAAAKETLSVARHGLDAHREIVIATRALLQLMQRVLAPVGFRAETCETVLAGVAAEVPWINGLTIVNPNGRVTCSTNVNSLGFDFSDRPYFQKALQTGDFVLGDYVVVGRGPRAPAMVGALRIASGEAVGVLVASVSLHWTARLAAASEAKQSSIMLLNERGVVLAAPSSESLIGRSFADHRLTRVVLDRDSGAVQASGFDGERHIVGFTQVPGTDMRLLVSLREADVLKDVSRETWIAYFQLALVLALVLGAWLIGMRLIMEPIRSLARTATRFGGGHLGARIPDRALVAEFMPLVTAFENMARKLGAREDALLSSNRQLERLAKLDALTGIANRRTFDAWLNDAWLRGVDVRSPLSLLMIDIDFFKLFNDHYGHLEGDLCLQAVGRVLAQAVGARAGLAARYGGEEFAVLAPDLAAQGARELALTVQQAIEDLRLPHLHSPTGRVSVSIGVATCVPTGEGNPAGLVEMADVALYEAKRNGRNRISAHAKAQFAVAS